MSKAERLSQGEPEAIGGREVPRDMRKQMVLLAQTGSPVRTVDDVQKIYGQGVQISQAPSTA